MGKPTERKSLKTIANRFPFGSLEYVYFHGVWQLSRGRRPSTCYGNHQTAKESFEHAEALVGDYLESVRRLPYSRYWPWSYELVEAIQLRRPLGELEKLTWL